MAISAQRYKELETLYGLLKTRILSVDDKYSLATLPWDPGWPETLGLEKQTYTPKSEEELRTLAEQAVAPVIVTRRNNAEHTYSVKMKSLSRDKSALIAALAKKIRTASSKYNDEKSAIERKVRDHGLYFSNVANKYVNLANQRYTEEVNEMTTDSQNERAKIEQEEADAEAVLEETYAAIEREQEARVTDEMDALRAKEEKARVSVDKYNNSIEEKEQKYQASRARAYTTAKAQAEERALRNAERYAKLGEVGYRALVQNEKYLICQDTMSSLLRDEANIMLTFDSFLRSHLGDYYQSLLDWINTLPR